MSTKQIFSIIALAIFSFAIFSCSNDTKSLNVDNNSNTGNSHSKSTLVRPIPNDRYYSEDDMWIKMIDDSTGVIGVTENAIKSTTPCEEITEDIPIIIRHPPKSKIFSVKGGVSHAGIFDAFSPVNGSFLNWNSDVISNPGLVSVDPYANWVLKVTGVAQSDLNSMMTASQYNSYIGN